MNKCLELRADYYAEIVLHNNAFANYVETISRSQLKKLLVEAYKQGYKDANDYVCWNNKCDQRRPPIPYECVTEETAKELEDILAKTCEESVKYVAIQKDLQECIQGIALSEEQNRFIDRLISKEEFRNRFYQKDK